MRRRIAAPVRALAHLTGHSGRRSRRIPGLRILLYHGIGSSDLPGTAFRAQMDYLRRNTKVVPLGRALERAGEDAAPSPPEVAMTFDDGLRSQGEIVPLLQALERGKGRAKHAKRS